MTKRLPNSRRLTTEPQLGQTQRLQHSAKPVDGVSKELVTVVGIGMSALHHQVQTAEAPEDYAWAAMSSVQVLKALSQDPQLMANLSQLLAEAKADNDRYAVTVSGGRGVQVGSGHTQVNTFNSRPA